MLIVIHSITNINFKNLYKGDVLVMSLQFTPFIMMNGKAKEAISYYEEVFGAKVLFRQTIGEGPKEDAARFKKEELDLVAHSVLQIGDTQIMISDMLPGLPFKNGTQISICITTPDVSTTDKFYNRLKEDGKVIVELGKVHFSPAYAIVIDKYGVTFQIFTARK